MDILTPSVALLVSLAVAWFAVCAVLATLPSVSLNLTKKDWGWSVGLFLAFLLLLLLPIPIPDPSTTEATHQRHSPYLFLLASYAAMATTTDAFYQRIPLKMSGATAAMLLLLILTSAYPWTLLLIAWCICLAIIWFAWMCGVHVTGHPRAGETPRLGGGDPLMLICGLGAVGVEGAEWGIFGIGVPLHQEDILHSYGIPILPPNTPLLDIAIASIMPIWIVLVVSGLLALCSVVVQSKTLAWSVIKGQAIPWAAHILPTCIVVSFLRPLWQARLFGS